MDFIMSDGGKIYCLEANTLPGMTSTSLIPQEANAIGMSFEQLIDKIAMMALNRKNR
jgi:D-alanine-D-alanine ligase